MVQVLRWEYAQDDPDGVARHIVAPTTNGGCRHIMESVISRSHETEKVMLEGFTRLVLRHRGLVVVAWVALALGGVVAAGSLGSAFSKQFSIPGKAIAVSGRIAHEFGAGGQTAPLVGVINAAGEDLGSPAGEHHAEAVFARMAAVAPGSRLASYRTTGDRAFLSADRHTEFALVFPAARGGGGQLSAAQVAAVRRAADAVPVAGAQVHVTGLDALRNTTSTGKGNGVVTEAMLGAIGALAVLAFVFASLM
jgi:RND superfamily putative drug exporter